MKAALVLLGIVAVVAANPPSEKSHLGVRLLGVGICDEDWQMGFLTLHCYDRYEDGKAFSVSFDTNDPSNQNTMIEMTTYEFLGCNGPSNYTTFLTGQCHDGIIGPNTVFDVTDECRQGANETLPADYVRIIETRNFPMSGNCTSARSQSIALEADCDNDDENKNSQLICNEDDTVTYEEFPLENDMCMGTPTFSTTFGMFACVPDSDESNAAGCTNFYCPSPPPVPTSGGGEPSGPQVVAVGRCGEGHEYYLQDSTCHPYGEGSVVAQVIPPSQSNYNVNYILFYYYSYPNCFGEPSTYMVPEGVCHDGIEGSYTYFSVADCQEGMPAEQYAKEYTSYHQLFLAYIFPNTESCEMSPTVIGWLAGLCTEEDEGSELFWCGESSLDLYLYNDNQCTDYDSAQFTATYGMCTITDENESAVGYCTDWWCPVAEEGPKPACHDHDDVLSFFADMYGMELDEDEDACRQFAEYGMCDDNYYGALVQLVCPVSCGQYDNDYDLMDLVNEYTEYGNMVSSCKDAVMMAEDGCFNEDYGSFLQELCPCACNEGLMSFIGGDNGEMPPQEEKSTKKSSHKSANGFKNSLKRVATAPSAKRLASLGKGKNVSAFKGDVKAMMSKITRDAPKL